MTRIGNYTLSKIADRYVLSTLGGTVVGSFPTARAANEHAIALITAQHKAQRTT
jgi:hypothetical protein